jgi:hypothetical protein
MDLHKDLQFLKTIYISNYMLCCYIFTICLCQNSLHFSYHKQSSACYLLHPGLLLGLFFDPEDEGDMFLRNVDWLSTDTVSYSRRLNSS